MRHDGSRSPVTGLKVPKNRAPETARLRRGLNRGASGTLSEPLGALQSACQAAGENTRKNSRLGGLSRLTILGAGHTSRVDALLFQHARISPGDSRTPATKGITTRSEFPRFAMVRKLGTWAPTPRRKVKEYEGFERGLDRTPASPRRRIPPMAQRPTSASSGISCSGKEPARATRAQSTNCRRRP